MRIGLPFPMICLASSVLTRAVLVDTNLHLHSLAIDLKGQSQFSKYLYGQWDQSIQTPQ